MASVKSANATLPCRTITAGIRRCKSHEPGQRVMTEAIAFLFTFYATQYSVKESSFICPTAEEFFSYARHLSLQTYHCMVPGMRRRVSSRVFGAGENGSAQFLNLYSFFDCIEPLESCDLASRLIQAQNIGLRALTAFTAFVDDDTDKTLKTHIIEPYVWFSGILFHDALKYRENVIGAALHYIQDGVLYLAKYGGKRCNGLFEAYNAYKKSKEDIFCILNKYLSGYLS